MKSYCVQVVHRQKRTIIASYEFHSHQGIEKFLHLLDFLCLPSGMEVTVFDIANPIATPATRDQK
jgi:hypothetical protein